MSKVFTTMKWIIISLLIIFLIAILFYVYPRHTDAIGVKEYNNLREVDQKKEYVVFGMISEISGELFTLMDIDFPEDTLVFQFETNQTFALGEYALIVGQINKDIGILEAKKVEKLNDNTAKRYSEIRKPLVDITILDYKYNCDDLLFTLELKNGRERDIIYENLLDRNFGYQLTYKVNDIEYNSYENNPISHFEKIGPNENKEILFEINPNLLSAENEISFSWIKKSLYDDTPEYLYTTEKINLDQIKCN
jgi:hypothetical protein